MPARRQVAITTSQTAILRREAMKFQDTNFAVASRRLRTTDD